MTLIVFILVTTICLFYSFGIGCASENYVRMYYFYSDDCKECMEIKDSFLPALDQKYGPRLQVKYLEIKIPENYELMSRLEKRFHALKNPPPTIFIGDEVLDGKREIEEKLEGLVKGHISKGGCDWPAAAQTANRKPQAAESIVDKFKGLGVPVIIGAGLLDGINPCAFTTIIFLISYLAFIGRKGKDLLFIGWTFTLGVFVTYLLIGLGLFEFTKQLAFFPVLSRLLSLSMAGLAAVLGILSIYDYYKIKKGKLKDIALQLPESVKDKIHFVIRQESRKKYFVLASLLLGSFVALLEFPCTGQVYLPIILVLRYVQDLRIYAFSYLVLYNIMFILPLVAVFIFAYKGASSETFAKLMRNSAGKVKIFTAVLFFVMAAILIASVGL